MSVAKVAATPPVSTQMAQVAPDLKSVRYTNLLNFENATDAVFITPPNLRSIDTTIAHTGRASLKLSGESRKMTVKLASLLGNTRKFPGDWTLAGAYFYADAPAQVMISCEFGGTSVAKAQVTLVPGQWAAAMLDLVNVTEMNQIAKGAPTLTFTVDSTADTNVWCDDVLLIDNTQWIIGRPETAREGSWMFLRRGMNYICGDSDHFIIRLALAEMQTDGWKVDEANAFRVRLSSTGRNKSLTLFPDGRSYWDGAYRPLSADLRSEPLWADQQASPAMIEVPETVGRLDRTSPGDENNDGYNECRASYTIIATGPRCEATILPRSTSIVHPLLEVSGLTPGNALVTVEGKLVERTLRLPDGTLLVEVPGRIERQTTVNIRIE